MSQPPDPSVTTVRTVIRDGREWTVGTLGSAGWLRKTTVDRTITSAIPALYERYATITEPDPWSDEAVQRQDARLIEILSRYGPADWWLGYLDTGSSDVVFPRARKVQLYPSWRYTIVQAGPAQALTWRDDLPDLIFPTDRSWCVNTLWDDSWTCVGGSSDLVEALVEDHLVAGRRVELGADATPPGHISI